MANPGINNVMVKQNKEQKNKIQMAERREIIHTLLPAWKIKVFEAMHLYYVEKSRYQCPTYPYPNLSLYLKY